MRALAAALLVLGAGGAGASDERPCGTTPDGGGNLLALHEYWTGTGALGASSAAAPRDADVDHVAILEDRGDLVARRNPFDLDRAGLRFVPNAAGGYDPVPLAVPLEAAGPQVLPAPDDGAIAVDLPFAFPFFGQRHARAFVHGDGSVTFGAPDPAGGERGMARFLAGPPRAAAFFTILNPSRGGAVTARLSADRAVFQWNGVPGGGQQNRNTFQLALLAGGEVELVFGEMQTREALVGVAPGGSLALSAADLARGRAARRRGRARRAVQRDRSAGSRLDGAPLPVDARRPLPAARRLHRDGRSTRCRAASRSRSTCATTCAGIGLDLLDRGREWGSAARLESVVYMDTVDPYLEHDGFEILGHEVGHRWLSRIRFRDAGGTGNGLLGRGLVHWSFFLDSDASVMEGNDIEERGAGRFETVDFARGYSALDQYAMGLRAPAEVPPFFFVEGADDFRPNRGFRFSSAPEAGVSFTGVRRAVRIEDVIAELGPRVPDHEQRAPVDAAGLSCWSRMGWRRRPRPAGARSHASARASRTSTDAPPAGGGRWTRRCPSRVHSGRRVNKRTRRSGRRLSSKSLSVSLLTSATRTVRRLL